MSAGATLLASGLAVNMQIHGEAFLYRPVSDLQGTGTGELVNQGDGNAIPIGEVEPSEITAIFDEAFLVEMAVGNGILEPRPVAVVEVGEIEDPKRMDVLTRVATDEVYYVNQVRPDGFGGITLILSRDAH